MDTTRLRKLAGAVHEVDADASLPSVIDAATVKLTRVGAQYTKALSQASQQIGMDSAGTIILLTLGGTIIWLFVVWRVCIALCPFRGMDIELIIITLVIGSFASLFSLGHNVFCILTRDTRRDHTSYTLDARIMHLMAGEGGMCTLAAHDAYHMIRYGWGAELCNLTYQWPRYVNRGEVERTQAALEASVPEFKALSAEEQEWTLCYRVLCNIMSPA